MRVAVFIDGASLNEALTKGGFRVDYRRLREWYSIEPDDTVTFEYFSVEVTRNAQASVRKLLDWLEIDGGFRVRNIAVNAEDYNQSQCQARLREARSESLVWLATEVLTTAHAKPDRIILWSGDGSMARVVPVAQRQGVAVTVVGDEGLCSSLLKRTADNFVEINSIRTFIERLDAA